MSLTQRIAGLTWDMCEPPASEETIAEHERALGVRFPDDFRSVIQLCPGGHPVEREDFWIDHPAHGRMGSGIGALVTLGPPDDVNGMRWCAHALRQYHELEPEVIPIALDGGGDFMCLDYREKNADPKVIYYSHEAPRGMSFCHIADTFTEFLELLIPADDDIDEEE